MTEIDLNSTYIGCDDVCRDALQGEAGLEALTIDPDAGIDWRSDAINPFPLQLWSLARADARGVLRECLDRLLITDRRQLEHVVCV